MFIPCALCTQFGEIQIEISFKISIFNRYINFIDIIATIQTYYSNYNVNKISKCFVMFHIRNIFIKDLYKCSDTFAKYIRECNSQNHFMKWWFWFCSWHFIYWKGIVFVFHVLKVDQVIKLSSYYLIKFILYTWFDFIFRVLNLC